MKLSLAKKTHNGKQYIVPSDDYAQSELEKLKDGEYMVTITKARNPKHHNQVFKFLNTLFENQQDYDTLERFYFAVKVHLGYCDYIKSIRNKRNMPVPESLSFENMDEIEFQKFHDALKDFAMEAYGIDSGAVMLIESFC